MSAKWFLVQFPPSCSVIENELRQALWKVGLGNMWLSCIKDEPPYECRGSWRNQEFALEWEPGAYIMVKTPEPNQDLLDAFERMLRRRALAAYRNGDGRVIVEWRAKDANTRWQELEASGVQSLERLDQ